VVVVCGIPLVFGLGGRAAGMALLLALLGLGTAAVLGERRGSAGTPKVSQRMPMAARLGLTEYVAPWWVWAPLGAAGVAMLLAWFPLLLGGAWSVAGHDLDTLQHQDGALHATMVMLCGQGVRPAPGYPLGLHALTAGLVDLLGINAFQGLAVVLVLLPGVLAASVGWAAGSLGLGERGSAGAALLAACHPLLMFTGHEQFGPQLAAAALTPAVLAACVGLAGTRDVRGQALVPGLLLGAVLSAYGLALSVAGPVALVALLLRRPWRATVTRLVWVGVFAVALAPLGVWRLAERLHGGSEAGQSPVKAAQRVKDGVPAPSQVLAPGAVGLGQPKEASSALRWDVTAAHLAGVSPYRDHFLRTARMLQTGLGRGRSDWMMGPLWGWANAMVPLATMILILLVLLGVQAAARGGAGHAAWGLAVVVPASAFALWMGAGTGIRPYYGFKLASLCAGLLAPAAVLGTRWVAQTFGPRVGLWVVLGLVGTRVPATTAVLMEYGRGLALDQGFTQLVEPTLQAGRNKAASAVDSSPTRRFWESRFLLAQARERDDPSDAEVVMCAKGPECAVEGRTLARSAGYVLWSRR
jgi:hypothetical protein